MIVIADASCLITLENIDEADILPKLYKEIYVTPEVAAEVGVALPDWALLRESPDRTLIERLTADLELGEATSIALALEMSDCLLIIDEKKGRRIAKDLGIKITGTFGIIMQAFEMQLIADPGSVVERLESVGFRISQNLKEKMQETLN
ncbi:MAG: DUF3368 domain-containing protein [Acidobacteria bacterium]|nr:DUF3368 domain-containing protein [Acidobacteriota bacterium]